MQLRSCCDPYRRFEMIDLGKVSNYYVACGYTDLRRGIDGLASIVNLQYGMELKEDSLFLFCGRRRDRIKGLLWEELSAHFCYPKLFSQVEHFQCSQDELN